METNSVLKSSHEFNCEFCDYKSCRESQYNRHLLTAKHIRKQMETNSFQKVPDLLSCECGRSFKTKSGLWKHKKTCKNKENLDEIVKQHGSGISEELVLKLINESNEIRNTLIKENQELRSQISEMIPKLSSITNVTNNNTTNNNQNFNIQVFLNEQCKDAINMSDFIKSIEVSLEQLDFTTNNGLANGLSKTIMDNMNKLSVYERPLHCTDVKRETLYIKEDDKWEKDKDKSKIKHAIKKASNKNYNALKTWKEENPDFQDSESKQHYFAHTISTIGKPVQSVDEKVIKKICSNTYLKESL